MDESASTVAQFRYCAGSLLLCLSIAAVQSSHMAAAFADDPLEVIKQTSVDSSGNLRSAVGVGTFEQYVQESEDNEPKLRIKAKVKVVFDQGKYHLRFDYETMLIKTDYSDMDGNKIDERLVEWKPDRLFVIYDGTSASAITFADRIKPHGCAGEVNSDLGALPTGFPWRDPARLGKESVDVERLVQNADKSSIQITKLPEGGVRVTFRPKNSDKVRYELDADPKGQFNVVAIRIFNEGDKRPALETELTWKTSDGLWYVEAINRELRVREPDSLTRNIFRFGSLDVNDKVEPSLFTLETIEVPKGTRFLDHRATAPNRILYYDGSTLTPQRP